jgi:hypothetical protein
MEACILTMKYIDFLILFKMGRFTGLHGECCCGISLYHMGDGQRQSSPQKPSPRRLVESDSRSYLCSKEVSWGDDQEQGPVYVVLFVFGMQASERLMKAFTIYPVYPSNVVLQPLEICAPLAKTFLFYFSSL